jgi:hypothetical protein
MTARPRFIYAYAEMALVADDVRRNRAEGDPALVEGGKLSSDSATTRLPISTALAVDWTAFARMELPPLDQMTDAERLVLMRYGHDHLLSQRNDRGISFSSFESASAWKRYGGTRRSGSEIRSLLSVDGDIPRVNITVAESGPSKRISASSSVHLSDLLANRTKVAFSSHGMSTARLPSASFPAGLPFGQQGNIDPYWVGRAE